MVGARQALGIGLVLLLCGLAGCSWPRWRSIAEGSSNATAVPSAAPGAVADATPSEGADGLEATARLSGRAPLLPAREPGLGELACRPALDDEGHLTVAEHTHALRFDRDQHHRLPRLAVWPYRSDAVLVAERPRWKVNQGAATRGTLWMVSCDGLTAPVAATTLSGADFGNAVLSGDTLYFSGPTGVAALHLDTRRITPVTEAPTIDDAGCRELYGARAPTHQRDVVRSLGRRGRLTFERGSYCGFEGDWEGTREVVVIPSGDDARA